MMHNDLNDQLNSIYGIWKPQRSVPDKADQVVKMTITNNLDDGLLAFVIQVNERNKRIKRALSIPKMLVNPSEFDLSLGSNFVVTLWWGQFLKSFQVDPETKEYNLVIDYLSMLAPNQIGYPPEPNFQEKILIPPDSPKVCVGVGVVSDSIAIVREQFWRLAPESYTLAPGAKRTVSFTTRYGMQDTTTEMNRISESLNLSTSVGWGPIQICMSAALNKTSSSTHSLTITTSNEKFESYEVENVLTNPALCLAWQLMDILSIFKISSNNPEATIVSAIQPCIMRYYELTF